MALAPKLEIKQSASLKLTPQLRQAINLLQMNNLELEQFVEQELSSNPLLEREDDLLRQESDNDTSTIDQINDTAADTNEDVFINDFDEQNGFDDFGSDTEGYNNFENADWSDYRQNKSRIRADDEFDYFSERLKKEKSLYEIIKEQIDLQFTGKSDRIIALILLENLDASGYFTADIATLAHKLKISTDRIENILNKMKNFEPSGIFAQNLSECLKIQLRDSEQLTPQMSALLDNLPLLAAKKSNELCRLCSCGSDELVIMIKTIKSLNPKPAADFSVSFNTNIIPDVIIKRNSAGEYRVELNSLSLPRLLINHKYFSEFNKDKKASRYLKENLSRASFIIKAMHSRAVSILRVAEEIVLRQYSFFEKGIENLKPMTLKDIADALDLSESTVSRVSTNKYMATPLGTFELKYFFSNAAGSYLGNDDTSTTAIKHKIKKLIENENPQHILSDEKIVELLEQDGTKIARRTIAKYRETLGIPSSAERKRLKRG